MSALPDAEFLLPLFPLPDLVFFPETRVPLHVFEPRYRQMIADVLARDQRFGIVLLRPGFEAGYFGTPAVYPIGTMGRIEQMAQLQDGRYNILVFGEMRFRIVGEISSEPYRTARVIAQPPLAGDPNAAYAQREWLSELSKQYLRYFPAQGSVPEIESAGLEALTNALIMSLDLDAAEKQRLLEVDNVVTRAGDVATQLESRIENLQFLAPFRHGGDPRRN